jgi:membrane protease subunit HflC
MNVKLAIAGVIIGVIAILGSMSLFIVHQTEQSLVLQFGDPRRVVNEPGLHFKLPWQSTQAYDKRVLGIDPDAEEVLLNDQKRILVNAYARYRIVDPLKFYQTVRNELTFDSRFGNILTSTVKSVIAQRALEDVLSPQRDRIMADIYTQANDSADDFGIELIDIRIGRSELPEAVSQNVYDRMRTDREREASLLRAEGEESARRIRSTADRQQVEIVAEAQREAEVLRGEGDALRNRILGEAYSRDPEFFDFFRSLEAYRETFEEGTTMVLSPSSDFFRYFGDVSGAATQSPTTLMTPGR